MSNYVRVDRTTIAEQIKEEEVNIVRNVKLLALAEDRGLITMNHSGNNMEWNIRIGRNSMTPLGDAQSVEFPRVNRHIKGVLPWRGYVVSESSGKMEKLQNRSPEARVNVIANLTQYMMDDIRYAFPGELFKDGNATGNENRIHGFPSFLAYTGSNQYTAPSDTYAGLSTTLGAQGGAITSGTWPDGQFDAEYDSFSPLILNYTHASWSASTDNWANNCKEVLRYGLLYAINTRGTAQGQCDLVLMTATMMGALRASFDSEERVVVNRGEANSRMVALGFKDTINFEGVDTSYDYYIPSGEAYGIKYDQWELRSMQGQLFVPSEDYDLEVLSDRYEIDFFGNARCNPRGFVFWKNIT